MARRDRIALALAPLMLRIGLGVVFVMAGLAKVGGEMTVRGEQAALLANMGVDLKPASGTTAPADPVTPTTGADTPSDGTPTAEAMPADGFKAPADGAAAAPKFSGADFPDDIKVRGVYGLALLLHSTANPSIDAKGNVPAALWPKDLAKGSWPVWTAWMVSIVELLGGALVLIGLTTRFWAAMIACVMVGAMWLTQIGPAIQSGDAVLGFLPNHRIVDGPAWQHLLTQFVLFTMAVALMLSRPGALSIDSALFGGRSGDDDDGIDDDDE